MTRSTKFLAVTAFAVVATVTVGAAAPAEAASLSTSQIQAVVSLLQAFGVDSTTITNVQSTLSGAQTSTSTTSATALSGNMIGFLRLGSKGDAVKLLQTLLAADPSIYPQGTISGYFGVLTQGALKRYQKAHGLEQVGFIGPKTLRALDDELQQTPLATESDEDNATSTVGFGQGHLCAIVPPGHLIAPGWLKHHEGEDQVIPPCQTLPPGI